MDALAKFEIDDPLGGDPYLHLLDSDDVQVVAGQEIPMKFGLVPNVQKGQGHEQ